jgi:hypothetical protein
MEIIKMNKKAKEVEKGTINFQIFPSIYSKCPFCGSLPEYYRIFYKCYMDERIRYKCGFSINSINSKSVFTEYGMCKNTKEWKLLKEKRLRQLGIIKSKVIEIVDDQKLEEALLDNISSLEYKIKDWWNN